MNDDEPEKKRRKMSSKGASKNASESGSLDRSFTHANEVLGYDHYPVS